MFYIDFFIGMWHKYLIPLLVCKHGFERQLKVLF